MIIYNPTDNHVYIVINGVRYSVEPKGKARDIQEYAANKWRETHQFLIVLEDDTVEEKVKKLDTDEDEVQEVSIVDEIDKLTRKDLEKFAETLDIDHKQYKKVADLRDAIKEAIEEK